jgi:Tfp pilus assembly protein PilF
LGIKLAEAEKMIRFAVAHRPRQSAYLDSLGWLMYKKGDYGEAVAWLQRAARAEESTVGGDPVITDHLADAQWRRGNRDEATRLWHAAWEVLQNQAAGATDEDRARAALRQTLPKKLTALEQGQEPEVAPTARSTAPQ